jgi:hypothetical protein
MCVSGNIEVRSRNHFYHGKGMGITYSVCVCARARVCVCVSVALVIQHAKRMRRIILSSETCLAPPYFSTLSHKRHDSWEKVFEHKMCALTFSTTFVGNVSHSKNSARYHKYT